MPTGHRLRASIACLNQLTCTLDLCYFRVRARLSVRRHDEVGGGGGGVQILLDGTIPRPHTSLQMVQADQFLFIFGGCVPKFPCIDTICVIIS